MDTSIVYMNIYIHPYIWTHIDQSTQVVLSENTLVQRMNRQLVKKIHKRQFPFLFCFVLCVSLHLGISRYCRGKVVLPHFLGRIKHLWKVFPACWTSSLTLSALRPPLFLWGMSNLSWVSYFSWTLQCPGNIPI